MTKSLICVGECMVELAQMEGATYRRGFAGDTFNAAWYARHGLDADWEVAYASCLGTDAVSDEMAAFMAEQGIATRLLCRIPERSVGLYMISLRDGERAFSYWRETSAARCLGDDPAWLRSALSARHVHFSGITMAILPPKGREALCAALAQVRAKGTGVSFDTNIRTRLWSSAEEMRAGITQAAAVSDIVLPSFDEEAATFGDTSPAATIERYRRAGARTVVVKNGAAAVSLWSEETGAADIAVTPVEKVVDTTAAGDSFAGAYLAAALNGAPAGEAVHSAAARAAHVVGAHGALVP